jgi:hypothetical protein
MLPSEKGHRSFSTHTICQIHKAKKRKNNPSDPHRKGKVRGRVQDAHRPSMAWWLGALQQLTKEVGVPHAVQPAAVVPKRPM